MNPAHYGSHPWIIVNDGQEGLQFLTGANPREFGSIDWNFEASHIGWKCHGPTRSRDHDLL